MSADSAAARGVPRYDVEAIRSHFPALAQRVHDKPLVYLDNAATTQKPHAVLQALHRAYSEDCANIHRGVHLLSQRATMAYDDTRVKVQRFLNAPSSDEIVFVRGTTEAINLVAQTFGRTQVQSGDEILITAMEHHANIVPWQMLCEQTGAKLKVAPINQAGELQLAPFEALLSPRTKLVALCHVSNALGTVNPVKEVCDMAHLVGATVLLDGAQAVPHETVDVQALGCDFYAFSAHKLYGPTGVGVLWGRRALLDAMPPYQGGGDMIASVTFAKTVYNAVPYKFEAGTPHIAGVIGMGAAIDCLTEIGIPAIRAHETDLLTYGTEVLRGLPGLTLVGTAQRKTGVLSFLLEGIHPHDIGTILDRSGVAIRTGHHCAQPVMAHYGVAATARASFGMYNTRAEIDTLATSLERVQRMFR